MKIQRLKKGIEDQKSRVQTTTKQESSLLAELERINGNIRNESEKLTRLQKDLAANEHLLRAREEEAAMAGLAKEKVQQHIKNRLNAFYRMGDIGTLNVVFSSKELPELLAFHEYFKAMRTRDLAAVREYREKVAELERTRLELGLQQQALSENIAKLKTQEKLLAADRDERIRLLEKVKTEKKLYQMALGELVGAADRLNSTIEKLKSEAAKNRRKESPSKETGTNAKKTKADHGGFAAQKGRLLTPAPGKVMTTFGKNTQNKFGISTFASGIDIKTAPGAKITAIYEGKIIYAKFLRGYGNLLIIDHGQQYLSLVSRVERFFKEEGDTVRKGEIIAAMSGQESLAAEGLHFEIRNGSKPEDPLLWLSKAQLTTGSD